MRRVMIFAGVMVLAIALFIGCGDDDNGNGTGPSPTTSDTCEVAEVIVYPPQVILQSSESQLFTAEAYDSIDRMIVDAHLHWATTASNVSIDTATGLLTANYSSSTAANVIATVYDCDGLPVQGTGKAYVISTIPDIIVAYQSSTPISEVALGVGDDVLLTINAARFDSSIISMPSGIEYEISVDDPDSTISWVLSGGNLLNITGTDLGSCDLTITLELKSHLISTAIPVTIGEVVDVSGQVIDAMTSEPIPSAQVSIDRGAGFIVSTNTNTSGNFTLTDIIVGNRNISVTKPNYYDIDTTIEVTGGGISDLVCEMIPETTWISGYAVENASRQGLNNVRVWIDGYPEYECTTYTTYSELYEPENGYFVIPTFLVTGNYNIRAERRGEFNTFSRSDYIVRGGDNKLDSLDLIWANNDEDWVTVDLLSEFWLDSDGLLDTSFMVIYEPEAVLIKIHFVELNISPYIGASEINIISETGQELQEWHDGAHTFDEWSDGLCANLLHVHLHIYLAGDGFQIDRYRYIPME